jgi:hypothetical protein
MMHRLFAVLAGAGLLAVLAGAPAQGDIPAAPKNSAWTLEEARGQLLLHPRDAYLQYVALQLARRENKLDEVAGEIDRLLGPDEWRRRRGRRADVDLFSIFTGALAVQESLQLDTMRGGPRPQNAGRSAAPPPPVAILPADEGKVGQPVDRRRREIVPIASLNGPTVKSHPWSEMLRGKKPDIDPLAKMVPDDFYFVQFRSINKLMEALETADLWGTHLFNQAYREARTQNVGAKLKSQLVVETNPLLKPFYDFVVEEVAVTGSDPFVCEGSDVTIVFRIKNAGLFRSRMDGFIKNAEKARPDARLASGEFMGVKYDHLATPDRQLHVFSTYPAENIHVRSNSKAAFQRVVEAIQGKTADGKAVTRLGDTPEFAYIRTIYPRGAGEEDGLIYLSDPHIRRLVGPQLKLTERRRMLCYNHLRMIGHGALLYRAEQGKTPDSLDALFKARCCPEPYRTALPPADAKKIAQLVADLDSNQFTARHKAFDDLEKLGPLAEAELKKVLAGKPSVEVAKRLEELLGKLDRLLGCPDGGVYTLAKDGLIGVCSQHGHAHFLTPNLEIPVKQVTGDEADEYRAFLEEYNRYWRTFFDPIAIRVQITPERYRLETIVLPLIDNSIYTGLALALGGKPEALDSLPVPKRNIFSVAMRFNKGELLKATKDIEREIKRDLFRGLNVEDGAVDRLNVTAFISDGIGSQVGLHVYDSVPNFDFNMAEAMGMLTASLGGEFRDRDLQGLFISFLLTSLNSPVYMSIPVQDAKVVDQFGDQLEHIFALAARQGTRGRWIEFASDFYQVPFKGDKNKMMRSFCLKFGPAKFRFFWARIGTAVYIASKDFILEDLLALENERAKVPALAQQSPADPPAHAMVKLRPQHWNQVLADYRLGWAENHRQACLNNQGPLSSVARTFSGPLGKIDDKELATVAERVRREADRVHQVHFFCPEGGQYVLAADGKSMTCNVHGWALAPRQPASPVESSPLAKQLERFAGMTASLTFMEEGLRAVVILERK